MKQLNYIAHKLLISRYFLFINLFIILAIYTFLYGNKIALCMNDTNISNIAEPKVSVVRSLQVMTPLQREVSEFLGVAETIQKQNLIIAEQEATINQLKTKQTDFRSNTERFRNALMLDHQNIINTLKTDVSKKVIIHNGDGTQTERYIILPEDLNRFKTKYVYLQKISFLLGLSTLLLGGGYYLLSQTGDASELQSATEILINQKEVVNSITSLKK